MFAALWHSRSLSRLSRRRRMLPVHGRPGDGRRARTRLHAERLRRRPCRVARRRASAALAHIARPPIGGGELLGGKNVAPMPSRSSRLPSVSVSRSCTTASESGIWKGAGTRTCFCRTRRSERADDPAWLRLRRSPRLASAARRVHRDRGDGAAVESWSLGFVKSKSTVDSRESDESSESRAKVQTSKVTVRVAYEMP